jgi:hypothetical protein
MGRTIDQLASKKLEGKAVFHNRFVVEICEKVHVHYRNLRIILSLKDWIEMAIGFSDALKRWEKMGNPETKIGTHIELCRKEVAKDPLFDDSVAVNLNQNLYALHEGKIFAEGSEIQDQRYIHLKIRDLRVELSLKEFAQLSEAVMEAKDKLCLEPQS